MLASLPSSDWSEIETDPHNAARATFYRAGGVMQAAPAPRFSRTQAPMPQPPSGAGANGREILAEYGYSAEEIETAIASGAMIG